jgi:aspartokinase/homoserine dehydrogenase 1
MPTDAITQPSTICCATLPAGIASAVFSTVRDAGVNVIMISQASSEHSICFAVKASEGDTAVAVLKKRFADGISAGR